MTLFQQILGSCSPASISTAPRSTDQGFHPNLAADTIGNLADYGSIPSQWVGLHPFQDPRRHLRRYDRENLPPHSPRRADRVRARRRPLARRPSRAGMLRRG
ncbi:MAG: hypothetical protein M0C28_21500 [Candidatus Moduliflexus flocculans]|nr:hypothetical protein [Candidatus Moduliflexus flocculans]